MPFEKYIQDPKLREEQRKIFCELKQAKVIIFEFNPDDEPNFDNPLPIKDDGYVSNNA